jgi:hypothetical protein
MGHWDPWKLVGIALALVMVTAVVTGMIIGSHTAPLPEPSALPRMEGR